MRIHVKRIIKGSVAGIGWVGIALLFGCSRPAPASPPIATPPTTAPTVDPYAGGQSYPWQLSENAGLAALALASESTTLASETPTYASNAWGPIERNASNGEQNGGDGKPLTLNGKVYAQGYGVHAGSELRFDLGSGDAACSTFSADVGLDDEVGSRGSAVFQVYGDGAKLYDSGILTGASAGKSLSVSVAGKKELRLIVTDAGDGISYDHADWGSPVLNCGGQTPATTIRINAGGEAQTINGQNWLGCTALNACGGFVSGGVAYAEARPISGVTSPQETNLYQTEWTGGATTGVSAGQTAFEFKVPVPNGPYQVKLHFAELNKTAGQRVFDVKLENQAVLSNFDLFTAAGGAQRPLVRSFPVTVGDNLLNIAFLRGIENAKISGIEIVSGATDAPTPGRLAELPGELVFSTVQNVVSASQVVALNNTGPGPLTISALNFGGANAAVFGLVNAPALPLTLAANQTLNLNVRFAPISVGTFGGELQVTTSAAPGSINPSPINTVKLYGLGARGLEGELEPTLQQIVTTLGYQIDVGSSALILGTADTLKGDEVRAPMFQKAGSGPVTLSAVARYSPQGELPFGYVTSGNAALRAVGSVAAAQAQTLNPALTSGTQASFDPGSASFSFYTGRVSFSLFDTFTDDSRNTAQGQIKHAVRVYPLRDRAGNLIANSYLLAFEPASNGDYNDYVFVAQNVTPVSPVAASAAPALSWTEQAGALTAVFESQGTAVGNKLYIFGGFTDGLIGSTKSQAYDAVANRWAALKDMPEPLTHAAVAEDGSTIYIAGGFIGNHPGPQTNHVWKYDTMNNTWSAGTPLPGARGGGALVRIGRTLHFVGGVERDLSDLKTYLRDSPEHWTFNLDGGANAGWQTAAPLPNPRNHTAGVALNGKLYVLGGQHLSDEVSANQTQVDLYDPQTDTWTQRASLPRPVGHTSDSTVVMNNRIVMIAGVTNGSPDTGSLKIADVNEYDPVSNTWRALTNLPAPRQSPVAGVIDGRLIVATGSLPAGIFNTTWTGEWR
ncbi:NPCBM/NEW2 domain-containing protein [Deinococcus sp.]|uniref:NPCBM/NEW2 domain-containing protein n=1 Tax=Deinococcus sp. TaxID=47478 RepID=UPI003B5B064B